jgi:hypothetical protein
MRQVIFVGIGAGIAAALLFLAPAGATPLAMPLFLITGLPIAIAGFGWSIIAGGLSALTSTVGVGYFLSPTAALVLLALFGAPMAWIAYLAGLSRAVDPANAASPREWYPYGRLLFHLAIAVALGVSVVGARLGFDPDALAINAADEMAKVFAEMNAVDPPTADQLLPSMIIFVAFLPFVGGLSLVLLSVLNAGLAARIVRASGRLQRPAQPLWTTPLAREILAGFAIATVIALFAPDVPSRFAQVFAGAFTGALVLVGLAVVHAVTLGMVARPGLLGAVYALVVLYGLSLPILAIVGAADFFANFRARLGSARPPSSPSRTE